MSRTANIILALAVIFLTAAVVTYFAPVPSGALTPDVSPLIVIGGTLLLAVYGVDSVLARRVLPFLRPAYVETQRQLSSVAHEGQRLLGQLNAYQASEKDVVAHEYWRLQVQRWTDWADTIINWRLPHLRPNFANEADRDTGPIYGVRWHRDLATWMQVRMKRLNEFILDADRLQHELGPIPSDAERSMPDWGEPPESLEA